MLATPRSNRPTLVRRAVSVALALAAVFVCLSTPAASKGAESFGQIGEAWGSFGTTPGKFKREAIGMFGVDPVDGSVYVGDLTANENFYRVQKFSPDGTLLGAAEFSFWGNQAEKKFVQDASGIAVDHQAGRFYVLVGCKVNEGSNECQKSSPPPEFGAIKILAFKTEPEGSKLVLEKEIQLPAGANELYGRPMAIAVDPANHELEVLGEDPARQAVLQRVKPNGELGARFVDTAGELKPSLSPSIAIGPDGTTYLFGAKTISNSVTVPRAYQLPESLSQLIAVPHFAEAGEAEGWSQPFLGVGGGGVGSAVFTNAPAMVISPNGEDLYWKQELGEGNVVIRGYSLAEGATKVVYGGGTASCRIKGELTALGTVGDDLVAIDSDAGKVITFGPGGSGCPTPSAQFTVNGKEDEGLAVEAEVPVTFDASGSKQEGEQARALVWNFGDGKTETVECEWDGSACQGEEVDDVATHKYLSSGTFTVSLQYRLEHPVFGNPPPVTHTVEVTGGGSGATFKLTVAKLGAGAGTVISERGINCGADCENEYREGKSVTLSAFPMVGSTFLGWGGACVGSGTCTVSLSGPKAVTATFEAAPAPPPAPPASGGAPPAAPAPPPATTTTPVKHKKTAAQKLKEKKQRELQRCKKLKNKRKRAQCVKKANAPAAKQAKHPKASGSGS
jgi:hypothetical protein